MQDNATLWDTCHCICSVHMCVCVRVCAFEFESGHKEVSFEIIKKVLTDEQTLYLANIILTKISFLRTWI